MPERERGQTLVSVVKKRDERLRPSHTTCPLMRSLPARRLGRGRCGTRAQRPRAQTVLAKPLRANSRSALEIAECGPARVEE